MVELTRPTPELSPPKVLPLFIGCMRKTSSQRSSVAQLAPGAVIFHTLPNPVVPSPVQRLPLLSKATPLVPGTKEANGLVGLLEVEIAMAVQTAEVESSEAQPVGSGDTFQTFPGDAVSAI